MASIELVCSGIYDMCQVVVAIRIVDSTIIGIDVEIYVVEETRMDTRI